MDAIFCPKCGLERIKNSNFCPRCGFNFNEISIKDNQIDYQKQKEQFEKLTPEQKEQLEKLINSTFAHRNMKTVLDITR